MGTRLLACMVSVEIAAVVGRVRVKIGRVAGLVGEEFVDIAPTLGPWIGENVD